MATDSSITFSRIGVTFDSYRDQVLDELKITGDFELARGFDFDHIRILREVYPPRMELKFCLLGPGGKVVSEGKRRLPELGYPATALLPTSDVLCHDKELIRSWMWREFKPTS